MAREPLVKRHCSLPPSGVLALIALCAIVIKSKKPIASWSGAPYLHAMEEKPNLLTRIWRALPFTGASAPLISVIELNGAIGVSGGPGRKALSMARLEKTIETAFKPKPLAGVALAINSPGGSPVQSRLIHNAIRRHAREKNVPVFSFIEDVGASGGYILAIAGDEIYADESSIVGSIGVISGGFGFPDAISRLGIERRVYTAGENKSTLDPFKKEDPAEIDRLQSMLDELHTQFKALVRERRPGKLAEDAPELFSGAFWAAPQAQKLGLIDGTAQLGDFLRARFGNDVKIKTVSPESGSLLKRLLSERGGAEPRPLLDAEAMLAAAETRALWARYGL